MKAMSSFEATRDDHARLTVSAFDGDGTAWDRFVSEQPGSSFCHLAGWRGIMADVMRGRPLYLLAVDNGGQWHAALPMVEVRSRILGHYIVSMPFLNYGGAVGTESGCKLLARAAAREASRRGVDLLELRCRRPLAAGLHMSQRKVTVTLELPGSAEALWSEVFSSKLRSQIRRPVKDGMVVRIGGAQVDAFYAVFSRHMRDLGTPVLPRAWFEQLNEVFRDRVIFGSVRTAFGEPVAAGCGFLWGSEFEMTWAAALRAHSRSAPNMLLYGSFMERLVERGVRTFNFGRCTPGGGTHRFKLQWGGRDEQLHWLQWSAGGVDATPSPERRRYRLAVAAWRQLPLQVANRLGPRLARNLP
jgi:FemAB-related protein (PEP-CTERM system-associated)